MIELGDVRPAILKEKNIPEALDDARGNAPVVRTHNAHCGQFVKKPRGPKPNVIKLTL